MEFWERHGPKDAGPEEKEKRSKPKPKQKAAAGIWDEKKYYSNERRVFLSVL